MTASNVYAGGYVKLGSSDNRILFVPNSEVMSNSILNLTRLDSRRIDLVIPVEYDATIRRAKEFIAETIANEARVLPRPEARMAVQAPAGSAPRRWPRPAPPVATPAP